MLKIVECKAVLWDRHTGEYRDCIDTPVIVGDYKIWATLADGRRFQHEVVFSGSHKWVDYDGEGGWSVKHGDKVAAEAFTARIQARGTINEAHWREIEGAYGSEAYQAQDAGGYFAWKERAADEENGGHYSMFL